MKTEQEVTTNIMRVASVRTMIPLQLMLLLQPLLSIPKVVPTLLPLEKSVFMSKTPGAECDPSFSFKREKRGTFLLISWILSSS